MKKLGWLVKKVLFIRDKKANETGLKASRWSFWRLAAGMLVAFLAVGILFSTSIVIREQVRGKIPRFVDYGDIAYFSRIEIENGRERLYVRKDPKGEECLPVYQVIDKRLHSCAEGSELAFTKKRGFVPTRAEVPQGVALLDRTSPSERLSILPGIIPIEEVTEENNGEIYSGVPKPEPNPKVKVASRPVKRTPVR